MSEHPKGPENTPDPKGLKDANWLTTKTMDKINWKNWISKEQFCQN